MKALLDIVSEHKKGKALGIYSVCSSHPLVIEAALRHAVATGETALLEATSNQVNQDGGYTGLQPAGYRDLVFKIASKVGLATDRVILGGDHLGPNCWQHLSSSEAMNKSDVLIKEYVEAGFRKIHLDCSMSCSDDPNPIGDHAVAERAARLCKVAEAAWQNSGGEAPVYIIGTEVPVPGGAHEDLDELALTSVEAATETLDIHHTAFIEKDLGNAWQRVIGLVVQPGVEFDHHKIIAFQPEKASELAGFIETQPNILFEAHSTDYQSRAHLAALVKDHFAILKVGPWLTFAMREAFWALDLMEKELIPESDRANLKSTILKAMKDNPVYWQKYYAKADRQPLDIQFSLSDRIRYYWPVPEVEEALLKLIENINTNPPPLTLVSQFMPTQYQALVSGEIGAGNFQVDAQQLIFHKISEVLMQYSAACNPNLSA